MRGRGVLASLAVVCAAVAFSPPARGDHFDFIVQLDSKGVSYPSIIEMIGIGKQLCHDLRTGTGPPRVLDKLRNTGFAPAESTIVLMSAVYHMCDDARTAVVAWADDVDYTHPALQVVMSDGFTPTRSPVVVGAPG